VSLADRLDAASSPRRSQCKTCRFLASLSAPDRAEWEQELANPARLSSALQRVMNEDGAGISSENGVASHRKNHVTPV
jgi:hypothetical protein